MSFPGAAAARSLRSALRPVTLAWVFGATWMYIVMGAAMTQFATLLHLPKFGFGILASLPFAGALAQLPASYLIERYGHLKALFITTGLIHRALWIVVALIPWALPQPWWWPALLVVIAVSWLFGQMVGPAWVAWMADLVPARIRGRYFSRRTQIGQFVGLIVTVATGVALDAAKAAGNERLMLTISLALALAGVMGMVDLLCFLRVPCRAQPSSERVSWSSLVRGPLANPSFRWFLGFTATLTFGIGYLSQFIWLYLFEEVGLSNTRANTMLVLGPLVVLMVCYPMWGRLLDRLGRKPVLLIAGLVNGVFGSVAWIFVTKDQWVIGYGLAMIATAAWPGVEAANFNLLLNLTTESGRGQRSAFVAINSLVAALAGILSGLFGGLLAEALANWRGTLCGWPLTYHGVLFLISGALRVLALGWLVKLQDKKAWTTQAALRYISTNLYSNLQTTVFTPVRLLQRLSRWTFSVEPPGPRPPRR